MAEIIVIGLDGGGLVLPITATKQEIVGAVHIATCEELRAGLMTYLFNSETYTEGEE